jgi:Rieske Fe-S protein
MEPLEESFAEVFKLDFQVEFVDLFLGRNNPWTHLYDPSRKMIKKGPLKEWVKANIEAQIQYKDWILPGNVQKMEDIKPGEGAIIREGLVKRAVYRDHKGCFFKASAVCPHLGGIVNWNQVEKTWDCPVHGSRFGFILKC